MTLLLMQITILLFVAVAGGAVVLTRDPSSQAIGISFYGILLALMFFLFQAPDVALSQIVIGAVALPLMIMLALAKVRMQAESRSGDEKGKRDEKGRGGVEQSPSPGAPSESPERGETA